MAFGIGIWSTSFTSVVASPNPTVTALSVAIGRDYGGTSVVLTGTNFTGTTGVTFNGVSAASYHVDSATQITATTAAGTASTTPGAVAVTNASGTGSMPSAWTYFDPFTNFSGTGVVGYRYENASVTGGKVTSWTEQFSGSNHLIQATGTKQPLYTASAVGGHAALQFSGGQGLATTSSVTASSARTEFVSFLASGTAGMIFEQSVNASSNFGSWLYGTTGYTINAKGGGGESAWDLTSNWSTNSTWRSCIVVCDGTHAGHQLYINGTAQSMTLAGGFNGNPGSTNVGNSYYVGSRNNAASLPMTGYICDFGVLTGALSAANIAALDEWLRGRVGL